MKKRTQNPIYIATTISVYLGLVLVGASPSVFAQLTLPGEDRSSQRNSFKCPNDGLIAGEKESELDPLGYDLAKRYLGLIESTDSRFTYLQTAEGVKPKLPFFFDQTEYAPYTDENGKVNNTYWEDDASEWSSVAHAGQVVELHARFLTPLSDCKELSKERILKNASRFLIDSEDFFAELKIQKRSSEEASKLAAVLNDLFGKKAATESDPLKSSIYWSTKAVSQSDQILVITRLPRASIPQPLDLGYSRP